MDIEMITIPELVSQALGSFLTSQTKGMFGSSHGRLTELLPFAAKLTLEFIGNSDALYHNVEHSMLVTLAGHDILTGRAMLRPTTPSSRSSYGPGCALPASGPPSPTPSPPSRGTWCGPAA